jgi:hypothetical protein
MPGLARHHSYPNVPGPGIDRGEGMLRNQLVEIAAADVAIGF